MKAKTSVVGTLLLAVIMVGLTVYIAERGIFPGVMSEDEGAYDEETQIVIQQPEEFEQIYENNRTQQEEQIKRVAKEYESDEEAFSIDIAIYDEVVEPESVSMYNTLVQEGENLEVEEGEARIGEVTVQGTEPHWECIWINENVQVSLTPIHQEDEQVGAGQETVEEICQKAPETIN